MFKAFKKQIKEKKYLFLGIFIISLYSCFDSFYYTLGFNVILSFIFNIINKIFLLNLYVDFFYEMYYILPDRSLIDKIKFYGHLLLFFNFHYYSYPEILSYLFYSNYFYKYLYIYEKNFELYNHLVFLLKIQHLNFNNVSFPVSVMNNLFGNHVVLPLSPLFLKGNVHNVSGYIYSILVNPYISPDKIYYKYFTSFILLEYINTELNNVIYLQNYFYKILHNNDIYFSSNILRFTLKNDILIRYILNKSVIFYDYFCCCYNLYISNINNYCINFSNILDDSLLICDNCLKNYNLHMQENYNNEIYNMLEEDIKKYKLEKQEKGRFFILLLMNRLLNKPRPLLYTVGMNIKFKKSKNNISWWFYFEQYNKIKESSNLFSDILNREYKKKPSALAKIIRKIFNNLPIDIWFKAFIKYIINNRKT